MKIKQIGSLILCFSMVLSLMACENSSKTASMSSSATSKTADSKTAATGQASQELLDSVKGTEMTITYPWAVEQRGDSANADRMYDNLEKIEKTYGVTIHLASGKSTYTQVMITSLMAGKPMGNVLMCQDNYFPDWYNAGIFCDLTSAAKTAGIDFSDARFNQCISQYTNVNNQQCGFYYGYDVGSSIFYNKRIFKELGLEDPYSLLAKGKWNFAAMEEYARLAKKEDANGNVDVWGLGTYLSSDFLACCVSANGGQIVGVGENGKPQMTLNNPATLEAMEYMYRMAVTNKTLDAIDPASWQDKMYDFIDGKYAMLQGTNSTLSFCYSRGMKDEYGVISFPTGPSNKTGKVDCMTNTTFYFIPKIYEADAAKYLFLMDKMNTVEEGTPEEQFSQSYALKLTDENSYNQYYARKNTQPRFELIYFSGCMWTEPGIGEISGCLASGTSTAGALADKYGTMLQSTLDDKWASIKITGKISK